MRPGGMPSVPATSSPVKREFTITTSQVFAACAYFAPCIRRVRSCTHSG